MATPGDTGDEAVQRWAQRHDMDPQAAGASFWVGGWARLTDACARPLAPRGVSPDAVTAAGLLVSVAVPAVAALGSGWPLLATVLVVAAAVLDGVDGALAGLTGTSSRWGQVLDPLADRCSDLLLLGTLGLLGAPWWLVVPTCGVTLLLESARAHAQVAGMRGPGVITVWERPSRVIVASFATALAALAWLIGADRATPSDVASIGAVVGLGLSVVGLGQLLRAVRRELREG